jgi:hypothetical protein
MFSVFESHAFTMPACSDAPPLGDYRDPSEEIQACTQAPEPRDVQTIMYRAQQDREGKLYDRGGGNHVARVKLFASGTSRVI